MKKRQLLLTDEELVNAILQEQRTELFGVLYDRYADKVYRKCISFARDRDAAQDMAQEVLLKVFTQLSKFKGSSRFSTWLYAVTYNYCVEYYRKHNRFTLEDIDETPDLAEEDPAAEAELLAVRVQSLRRALDRIHPEDKALLMMKYQDDVPIRELMEQLQISESAVKMRLARARQRVKELIDTTELQHS
ncbi:MAG: sigma-70 family RNA polymerase sigma factor [Bacteroidia bacterium]|nr:sigma-70 family RNA polymerase sigma factor [Bacteroidia bacterium]